MDPEKPKTEESDSMKDWIKKQKQDALNRDLFVRLHGEDAVILDEIKKSLEYLRGGELSAEDKKTLEEISSKIGELYSKVRREYEDSIDSGQ